MGFINSLHSLQGEIQLSKRGLLTKGVLTSSRQEFSEEHYHHFASYRFTLSEPKANTVFRNEVRVNGTVYQALQQGSYVNVRYLPEDPPVSRLELAGSSALHFAFGVILYLLVGAIGVLVLGSFRGQARR